MQMLPVLAVLAFFSLLAKLWRKIQYELDLAELDEFDVLEELDAELALSSLVARFWGRLSCVESEDDEIIESINQIGDIVAAVISLYENGMNVRGKFYSYNANNKCISKLTLRDLETPEATNRIFTKRGRARLEDSYRAIAVLDSQPLFHELSDVDMAELVDCAITLRKVNLDVADIDVEYIASERRVRPLYNPVLLDLVDSNGELDLSAIQSKGGQG